MGDFLTSQLAAKFLLPKLPKTYVQRPHLINRLNTGLDMKLTIISGPAGSGKTTLTGNWANQVRNRIVWVSLDSTDDDPLRLAVSIVEGFRGIDADFGEAFLEALNSQALSKSLDIIPLLINELEELSEEYVLILDNYHYIQSQNSHQLIKKIIDFIPHQLHIFIISRLIPSFPLARLRAENELNEISSAEMNFKIQETGEYITDMVKQKISEKSLSKLHKLTEGWIAGLQMSALSLQKQKDMEGFILSLDGINRDIYDFMEEEVFSLQPEETQEFLLKTSILDSFNPMLCEAVTGKKNTLTLIKKLEASNLFIFPLDDRREWYRYHSFFSDGLRLRLNIEHGSTIPELHMKASVWYKENEMPDDAVKHALASGNFDMAADLMTLLIKKVKRNYGFKTLQNWINALPESIMLSRPLLIIIKTMLMMHDLQFDKIDIYLRQAEKLIPQKHLLMNDPFITSTEDAQKIYRGRVLAVKGSLSGIYQEFSKSKLLSEEALNLLSSSADYFKILAMLNISVAYHYEGKLDDTETFFTKTLNLSRQMGLKLAEFCFIIILAQIEILKGNLSRANAIIEDAMQPYIERYEKNNDKIALYGILLILLGDINREHNSLDNAEKFLLDGIRLSKNISPKFAIASAYVSLARILIARNDNGNALEMITRAEQTWPIDHHLSDHSQARKMQILIKEKNFETVNRWIKIKGIDEKDAIESFNELVYPEYLTLARYLIATDKAQHAISLLEKLEKAAINDGRNGRTLEILVLLAHAYQVCGHFNVAVEAINQALSLAEPEGYIRIFLDEDPSIVELLKYLIKNSNQLHTGCSVAYLEKIISSAPPTSGDTDKNEDKKADRDLPDSLPWAYRLDPLTNREMEVLNQIALGLNNQEIAEKLFISLATVKTHSHKIFSKLDVKNRIKAVHKALEIGIIDKNDVNI